jgi:3-oxoacyl-[acyl-carrier-protein] synthase II
MELRRVVVTGLGALTPVGNTVPELWNGLKTGVSGAGPITRFDATKFKTQFACEVKNFDPLNFFDRKEVRKHDPYTQYGMVVADEAILDAGLDVEKMNPDRIGVIWASGIGGMSSFQEEVAAFVRSDGTPRFTPYLIPKMIADIAAGHISIKYGFKGPNFATISACASSANALIDAFNYIRINKADIFVTGGSEACINEAGVGGFNSLHALSTRNDDPKTASRPFDLDRDGFVIGEGGACLIFEELDHALARGAKIYCEVAGAGMSADAYHITAPHPEGHGAMTAMRLALDDAGMNKEELDHINTHGTSTPLGDVAEIKQLPLCLENMPGK